MGRIGMFLMGLLLLWCMVGVSEAECMKYKDPKHALGVRIKNLMKRTSLEEKVGEMTHIVRKIASPDIMKQYFIVNYEIKLEDGTVIAKADTVEFTVQDGHLCPALAKAVKIMKKGEKVLGHAR